jgi:hypothetical protein
LAFLDFADLGAVLFTAAVPRVPTRAFALGRLQIPSAAETPNMPSSTDPRFQWRGNGCFRISNIHPVKHPSKPANEDALRNPCFKTIRYRRADRETCTGPGATEAASAPALAWKLERVSGDASTWAKPSDWPYARKLSKESLPKRFSQTFSSAATGNVLT